MLEKALIGTKRYYGLLAILAGIIALGFMFYLKQLNYGLGITGMSRDVSWGFYIAQFTYLVGVAASAVMVVLPYYLHDYKAFGRVTILGEFLAVAAVTMCILFITVDLGRPDRIFNVLKYPTPGSVLFWDMIVLNGYLILNLLMRAPLGGAAQVAEALYLYFHSLGRFHPHCDRVPVCRLARPGLLAHRHHGSPVSVVGLCRRSVAPHSPVPPGAKVHQV